MAAILRRWLRRDLRRLDGTSPKRFIEVCAWKPRLLSQVSGSAIDEYATSKSDEACSYDNAGAGSYIRAFRSSATQVLLRRLRE